MTTSTAAPANAAVLDSNGQMAQAWRQFLSRVGAASSQVGDYLQTARDPGGGWLLCDGSAVAQTDYPALYAILMGITAPGGTAGTFMLPGIAAVYDPSHPGPGGPPVLATWIKAL